MKRSCSILLALSSLLWAAATLAASRPHYGGALRIAVQEAPAVFDPAALSVTGPAGLSRLVFETLVALDDHGRPQPLLASSWQAEPGNQRWRFLLRSGVSFHDGSQLDANTVAASLRANNPEWKVFAVGDIVMIETNSPVPGLPAALALPRNGIFRRADGKLSGTGPFALAQWDTAKHLTLQANEQYWGGRPFLDSVEVDLGKNYREQLALTDLGKVDIIEIAPESIRRAQADGRNLVISEPAGLLALLFASQPRSEEEAHARNALALSIDTAALNNFVLQGSAEPTGALLPNWVSGYAFAFPAGRNAEGARQERILARHLPSWTLGYDASDPLSRLVAERIQLNARDVGIALQLASSGASDIRLLRIMLPSPDLHVALAELAKALQLLPPKFGNASVTEVYTAENALLQTHQVIPLLHVRGAVALHGNVHDWSGSLDGEWHIENVWLGAEKP